MGVRGRIRLPASAPRADPGRRDPAASAVRIGTIDRRQFVIAAAAAPFAALVPSALARSRGGTPLALVTADLESRIVAVELSTGRIYRHVPTLRGPRSIESLLGRVAVVAHTSEGAVTLVDGPTLRVRRVLGGFGQPRYTAGHPAGRYAYVTDSRRGDVAVLDVLRGEIVHRVSVGGPARHIAIDRRGRTLWIALGAKAEEVVALDLRDPGRPRAVRRIRPPYLAHDVGFTPDGRTVWVTSGGAGTVGLYDARSFRLRRELPAGSPPQHVTFAGGRAYVASGDDGTLTVHSLDGSVLHETAIPVGSYNVQEGWGVILTPSLERGTLSVVSERGAMLHRVAVARSSHDACFVMAL